MSRCKKALARVVKQTKKKTEPEPQHREQDEHDDTLRGSDAATAAPEPADDSNQGATDAGLQSFGWTSHNDNDWRNNWWHGGNWGSDGRGSSWAWSEAGEQHDKEIGELPDILPDVVLGWLLLQKSGLDAGERATVLATTRNKLGFDAIEAALRSVWTEADVRNRDQGRGRETRTNLANAVYFGADALTWQSESEDEESEDEDEDEDDDILEEEAEAYVAAQQKEVEAKEALVAAQRTLTEARKAQAQVKLQRRFYGNGQGPKTRVGDRKRYTNFNKGDREKGSPKGPCFRCGGKHYARDCPDRGDHRLKPPKQAHLVMMASRVYEPPAELSLGACNSLKSCFLAQEATRRGKAVIDCGATESLGGIAALENLAKLNAKKYGTTKMRIDRTDRPTYTFGNGESAKVDGRATFEVEVAGSPGTIDFHGIDAKGVPMLLSAQSLRKMGAVINFENGQAKFLKLHPEKIVQLEKSSTGHWLLDLSEDLYAREVPPDAVRLTGNMVTTS